MKILIERPHGHGVDEVDVEVTPDVEEQALKHEGRVTGFWVGRVQYMHVAETPAGRWIFRETT